MIYATRSKDHFMWAEQTQKDWSMHWLKWSVDLIVKHSTEEEQETLPYISNENIESWTGKLLIEDPQPVEANSRKFKRNDVLFNKLRPYLAKVYHASFNGVSSSELLCLRPSQDLESRFLFYVLLSKDFIDTANANSYGAKMPRADWEIVGHQSLPFPPLDTQLRIAKYLDEKTALIDALIEKKREHLDLLAEKRQALITQAVTKGFPDSQRSEYSGHHSTRRRDCRVAEGVGSMIHTTRSKDHFVWAEQTQKDWSRHWLKWSVDLIVKHSTEEEQETLPYISNENIESWTGKLLIEDPQPVEANSRKFKRNDVLFNKLRPYLAKVYHASFNGVSSSELLCLRPSQDLESRFLFYVLLSKDFIDTANANSYGAKMPRADWEIVGHQSLPFPPLDTQRRIANFLDKETSRIDELVMKIRESIALLEEFRSAQITAAVKGQITEFQ